MTAIAVDWRHTAASETFLGDHNVDMRKQSEGEGAAGAGA